MRNRTNRHSEYRSITTDERGVVAILAIIIITALVVLISTSLGLVAIGNLQIGFSEQRGNDLLLTAESCTEEAILRLSRDNTYTGGSLTVGDVDCTIAVTGTPCGSCTISTEATAVGFTRNIQAGVTISGSAVDITSWEEID